MTPSSDGQRRGQRVGQAVDLREPARRSGRRPAGARAARGAAAGRAAPTVAPARRRPRAIRAVRSSIRAAEAARGDGLGGPRPRPGWRPARGRAGVVARRPDPRGRRSAGSVVESGTPGAGADERRLEDAGVGPAAGDDDVVGAGRVGQLVDDGAEDRVGRRPSATGPTGSGRTIRPPRAGRPRARRRPGDGGSAASPTTSTRPTTTQSIGRRARRRAAGRAIRPRTKNEAAKIHQARRIRRSGVVRRVGRSAGWVRSRQG